MTPKMGMDEIPPIEERKKRPCKDGDCIFLYDWWYCMLEIERETLTSPCLYHITEDEYRMAIDTGLIK